MEENMKNLSSIGNIKELRKNSKLTQATVAKYCGVSLQAYNRWEHGLTKVINEDKFNKLKHVLGIGD